MFVALVTLILAGQLTVSALYESAVVVLLTLILAGQLTVSVRVVVQGRSDVRR